MKRDYGELFEHVEDSVAYWASVPLAEFSRSLDRLLVTQGVTRARLANFLGCSRPYVTKVLSGEENLTATTMARFAKAVGAVVHVHVAARDAAVYWRESHDGMGSVKAVVPGGQAVSSFLETDTEQAPAIEAAFL